MAEEVVEEAEEAEEEEDEEEEDVKTIRIPARIPQSICWCDS